jgi:thiol:disulfide interchange protein DsbD
LEIPQSIQTKIHKITNKKSSEGSIIGVAIMGFLSALIVGPCVAPPLAGALVYIGQTGDAILGGAALFFMSLGMGLPLLLVGAGAGKFMPRPGGWMDAVSKVFGVVMLGIAIFMLERILPSLYYMILWALLFMGSAIYLLKFDTMLARFFTVLAFIIGFIITLGAGGGATNPLNSLENIGKNDKQSDVLRFEKVSTLTQLDLVIQTSNKPIMLDFYASWCASCKELENTTFKDQKVIDALKDFVVLKVDVTNNTYEDGELLKKFNLFGPPAIIFWDRNGNEITQARLVGYKNSDEFLEHLDRTYK